MADYGLTEFISKPLAKGYVICPKCFNPVPIPWYKKWLGLGKEIECDLCDTPIKEGENEDNRQD